MTHLNLNRKLALQVLRDPRSIQAFGTIGDENLPGTRACGNGHIWRLVLARSPNYTRRATSVFCEIAKWLEIPEDRINHILVLNDAMRRTLPQIADYLEGVFHEHPVKPTETTRPNRSLPPSLTNLLDSPESSPEATPKVDA